MKYFFVEITQQDGEHEHTYKAVGTAPSQLEMQHRMIMEQDYQVGEDPEHSLVAFGDGLTAAHSTVREIEHDEYAALRKFLGEV